MSRLVKGPATRCACGNVIAAESIEPWAIETAVRTHNLTPTHLEWRRRREKVNANSIRRARLRREIADIRLVRELRRETLDL